MFRYSPLGQRLMKEQPQTESVPPVSQSSHSTPSVPSACPSQTQSRSTWSVLLVLGASSVLGYLSYRNLRNH